MIEITNRTNGPLQLMVRSSKKARSFTTQVLLARGSNKNVIVITDEKYTDQIGLLEHLKFISTRQFDSQMSTKEELE